MIGRCWWRIIDGVSRRNLEVCLIFFLLAGRGDLGDGWLLMWGLWANGLDRTWCESEIPEVISLGLLWRFGGEYLVNTINEGNQMENVLQKA